jgi:large subunit ribosomal protein L24
MSTHTRIKKEDQVKVVAGKEKGKTGRVLRVIAKKNSLLVEKVNLVKRHTRPSSQHRQGGIIEKESPIHISNVMIICTKCNTAVKMGSKTLEDGVKVRCCKKCGEVIDL